MAGEQQRFGKYRLLRRIAAGGMGEVHLAKLVGPAGFEKLVVIKRLLEQRRAEPKYLEMFFGEARVAAQLNHSNIVQIYETGEVDGVPYIAMEYVHGKSLRKILDAARSSPEGVLPAAFAGTIIAQLCRGLSFAHNAHHLSGARMDLIHRDINPLNVLVSYQGEVKIIDFGIAKSELTLDKTQAGTIKGTVVYMSPEQSLGHKLDRRSDLFSVGICLYEALSNINPFHKGSLGASLDAIRRAAAPPIDEANSSLRPFVQILAKVLAAKPDSRLDDCAELADLLEALLASGRLARPMVSLSSYMQALFAAEMEQEAQNLERTDFANLDDLQSVAPARSTGTAVVRPPRGDRLDGERTAGRGRPMLQTSSVFGAGRDGTNPAARALMATSMRGTPQAFIPPEAPVGTGPADGLPAELEISARTPRPRPYPLPEASGEGTGDTADLEDTEARAGPQPSHPEAQGRVPRWLGRASLALSEHTPQLMGLLAWGSLSPGRLGGRFGLPALLVVCVCAFGAYLVWPAPKHTVVAVKQLAVEPASPKAQTPFFLEGELESLGTASKGQPQAAAKPSLAAPARSGRVGQGDGESALQGSPPLPDGLEPPAHPEPRAKIKPLRPSSGVARPHRPSKQAGQHEPMVRELRPSEAIASGTEFRLRADPPMSLRHNGQIVQNPVQLHNGHGLLEFRSGPSNGTFAVKVVYEAIHGAVDLTVEATPFAEVYGAGGIKLGRTPLVLHHVGTSTPLVLKNPHVSVPQYITLKLSGLADDSETAPIDDAGLDKDSASSLDN